MATRCSLAYKFADTCSNSDTMATTLNPARILVVDDEGDILQAARLLLKRHFASVETSSDPTSLPERVRQNSFDVLLLDMNFSAGADDGAEGLKWLTQVLAIDPQAVVVLVTAHSGVELAVQAMKQGAADFVTKPWENERLLGTLLAAVNLRRSRIEAAELRNRNRGLAAATHIESGMSRHFIGHAASVRRHPPCRTHRCKRIDPR